MMRAVFMIAVDLALGFGAASIFMLIYGFALGAVWPQVFGAEWPFLGADAAGSLLRARVIDAVLGAAFGAFLAVAAMRGLLRKPHAGPLLLAVGIMLYAVLNAHALRRVLPAILETPLPWAIVALIVASAAFTWKERRMRDEV